MKTKVIYHQTKPGTDCPDGIAAAWVCSKALPTNVEFEGCVYQGAIPDVQGCEQVYLVDFSLPAHILESWADEGIEVVVIDHHQTALDNLSSLSSRVLQRFDLAECGATLTWKFFYPDDPIPAFLRYVKDRDLWDFELPFSEEIHEAIANLKYQRSPSIDKLTRTFAIFDMLEPLTEQQLQIIFTPVGANLLQPKRQRIEELAWRVIPHKLREEEILTVEVSEAEARLISDLCSFLYKNNPQYMFVVAWYKSQQGFNLSFRSHKHGSNFDVSAIAKSLGGGGHRNAAGAVVSQLPWV